MDYHVKKLDGQGYFNVYVVSDDKNEFKFWMKNTTQTVNQVVVIFDNKNANIQLQDGRVVLSLDGIVNFKELEEATKFFINNTNNGNIKLYFVVENENQRLMADALGSNLNVSYEIMKTSNYKNNKIGEVEEKLKEQNYTASGNSKTIEVQNGNSINKITVSDNKAYVNSGILSIDEQKYILLQEWKKDPYMSRKMIEMSEAEIDRMLVEYVTSNLKGYRMESTREQVAVDKVGEVAMNKASNEDGKVNTELGLVENNVSNVNSYSVVEKKGDGVQVVNPVVTSSHIDSGGINSSSVGSESYLDADVQESVEQSREVIDEFYVDDEYNVYDGTGNVIGKIGKEGLFIDYNNNTLVRNGQVLGCIGDYNDMGKNNQNSRKKANVRVLKKKDDNKSAAFVSFSVIIFVLSAMLLIGSVILLFVLD